MLYTYIYIYLFKKFIIYIYIHISYYILLYIYIILYYIIVYINTCKGTQYIHSMGIFVTKNTKDAQLNQAGSMGEIVKSGIVNSNGYAMDVFLPPMDVIIGVLIHILGIYIYIYIHSLSPCIYTFWLVVWNMNGWFFHILGISYSQLTKSYFSDGLKPPTGIVLIHSHVHI